MAVCPDGLKGSHPDCWCVFVNFFSWFPPALFLLCITFGMRMKSCQKTKTSEVFMYACMLTEFGALKCIYVGKKIWSVFCLFFVIVDA